MPLAMPSFLWDTWCSWGSSAQVFYNAFGVMGRALLTFSSVSQRVLELLALIIAAPRWALRWENKRKGQTGWSVDNQVSIVLLIYIQFISVTYPITLFCSLSLIGVVLSALPFSQFPHRLFKKKNLSLCASFHFLFTYLLATHTTDTCGV